MCVCVCVCGGVCVCVWEAVGVRGRTFCTTYNSGSNTELKVHTQETASAGVAQLCMSNADTGKSMTL